MKDQFRLKITRRDFINGVVLGAGTSHAIFHTGVLHADGAAAGSAPLRRPASDWYGYGGVGDYAASHGNTPAVVEAAHRIRDGVYEHVDPVRLPVDESYDVVVVGAGIAGLAAALTFTENSRPNARCLVLENHPIFGGEAKRNEFEVNGTRICAPQGANGFSIPDPHGGSGDALWYRKLNVPREFQYQDTPEGLSPLRFSNDNVSFLYGGEAETSTGYFYSSTTPGRPGSWVTDPWRDGFSKAPISSQAREELIAWRGNQRPANLPEDDRPRWLDSMSYQQFLENVLALGSTVPSHFSPIISTALGQGCDAISAYAAYKMHLPGVRPAETGVGKQSGAGRRHSFPGGTEGFARYLVKRLLPDAIAGTDSFHDILMRSVNPDALDQRHQRVRIRTSSTVFSVKHEGAPDRSPAVLVGYLRDGKPHVVRARAVVMATGSWINRHILQDVPEDYQTAFASLVQAPFLIANVALTNWRFLYNLGMTACVWNGGFGFSCSVRRPMRIGEYCPPLHPDSPIVLTFYVPFLAPGLPPIAQAAAGRVRLFSTSFQDFEQQILAQMNELFSTGGFNARRDVAGIILNRWGHALHVPTPGFYYGTQGRRPAAEILRMPHGRIAIGHSELDGIQHWGTAADEGARAMMSALQRI